MAGPGTLNQPSIISAVANVTFFDIDRMLNATVESQGLPTELLNMHQLRQSASDLFTHSIQDNLLGDIDLRQTNVPLDRLSLLFATLALHSFPNPDPHSMPAFLELSTIMTDNYAGEPTVDLVSAIFIQHTCVLRTGTGNRSRSLIAHAVQVAHDLGIQNPDHDADPQHLRIYLMIYFADQYCALTHNTAPCIKATDMSPELFDPLLVRYPRLQRFVKLISLNGRVLESIYTRPYTYDAVIDLESIMGNVCAAIGKPMSSDGQSGQSIEFHYENLVQIHVFWSRMILRAPLLLSERHWISSLSVCLRAAQMLLSIYFDILRPVIMFMATTALQSYDETLKRQLQTTIVLPPTWRQVRRIAASIFIIIYAYWKGEASHEEASRSAAMALALLEFQRTRWKAEVQPAITTVRGLVTFSGLEVKSFMQQLVPDATAAYLTIISEEGVAENEYEVDHTPVEDNWVARPLEQSAPMATTAWWEQNDLENIFDAVSFHDLSSFGLWENN
ncbi:hypothetical protein LTR84_011506 [Exophiala bonariae]|uniref:Transcription factor domain-containing protein n=1 Tax=Exophiala bonariae TaxID=1690606 RepID=A0AAV9NGL9_9EURO|nr:hypothetical protein LTR84_011506 [Exophiala bonariae]